MKAKGTNLTNLEWVFGNLPANLERREPTLIQDGKKLQWENN